MNKTMRSVGFRNAVGNIAGGAAFLMLSLASMLGIASEWRIGLMAVCITLGIASIALNYVRGHEPRDEMYWENMGKSSIAALSAGLIVLCIIALIGIVANPLAEVRVTDAVFFALGVFQLLLGALFAWNENGGEYADD